MSTSLFLFDLKKNVVPSQPLLQHDDKSLTEMAIESEVLGQSFKDIYLAFFDLEVLDVNLPLEMVYTFGKALLSIHEKMYNKTRVIHHLQKRHT